LSGIQIKIIAEGVKSIVFPTTLVRSGFRVASLNPAPGMTGGGYPEP
jgi:hypothetical protein